MALSVKIKKIDTIKNWDVLVRNSHCGTLFQEQWYLKARNVSDILCVFQKDKIVAALVLYDSNENKLEQSTIKIPYGGPIFFLPEKIDYRRRIILERNLNELIIEFLINKFEKIDFSVDTDFDDIIPYIRNGFSIEYRFTYTIILDQSVNELKKFWGSDRKKDLIIAKRNNLILKIYNHAKTFDIINSLYWEEESNKENSYLEVKAIIDTALKINRGKIFVAYLEDKIVAAVFVAWDHRKSYILYSYYDRNYDVGAICFLYYNIFRYTQDELKLLYVDLEGSVLKGIEDFDISFSARQVKYFNLHWSKNGDCRFVDYYNYE